MNYIKQIECEIYKTKFSWMDMEILQYSYRKPMNIASYINEVVCIIQRKLGKDFEKIKSLASLFLNKMVREKIIKSYFIGLEQYHQQQNSVNKIFLIYFQEPNDSLGEFILFPLQDEPYKRNKR